MEMIFTFVVLIIILLLGISGLLVQSNRTK